MFDIAFSEMLVIGIIALIVIGPERLPKVARTVGALLGRARRYVNNVKADIDREIRWDELRALQADFNDSARDIGRDLRQARESLSAPLGESVAELENTVRTVVADSAQNQPMSDSPAAAAEHREMPTATTPAFYGPPKPAALSTAASPVPSAEVKA